MRKKQKANILIVSDKVYLRRQLKQTLTKEGYLIIDEGNDGHDAINLYRKHKPDIAIIDFNLPLLDGVSASEIITKQFNKAKILLIVDNYSKKEIALEAGVMEFLRKPVDSNFLTTQIANMLLSDPPKRIKDQIEKKPDTTNSGDRNIQHENKKNNLKIPDSKATVAGGDNKLKRISIPDIKNKNHKNTATEVLPVAKDNDNKMPSLPLIPKVEKQKLQEVPDVKKEGIIQRTSIGPNKEDNFIDPAKAKKSNLDISIPVPPRIRKISDDNYQDEERENKDNDNLGKSIDALGSYNNETIKIPDDIAEDEHNDMLTKHKKVPCYKLMGYDNNSSLKPKINEPAPLSFVLKSFDGMLSYKPQHKKRDAYTIMPFKKTLLFRPKLRIRELELQKDISNPTIKPFSEMVLLVPKYKSKISVETESKEIETPTHSVEKNNYRHDILKDVEFEIDPREVVEDEQGNNEQEVELGEIEFTIETSEEDTDCGSDQDEETEQYETKVEEDADRNRNTDSDDDASEDLNDIEFEIG